MKVPVRPTLGAFVLLLILPTGFGLVGTMYKGGFPEGFVVGLVVEAGILTLIGAISLGLWLLGVFD